MVRSLSVENDALRKVNISSFKRMKNRATCLILGYVQSGNMFDPWICDMSVVL